MKVHYNKGMGCPVEISDGKTATCISLDAAKELQANLSAIIEQAENTPEEEMSEMEISLLSWLSDDTSGRIPMKEMKRVVKARATELLHLAKQQLIQSCELMTQERHETLMEILREDCKKDMPRWKKATGKERFNERIIVYVGDNDLFCTNYAEEGEYYLPFHNLERLPGFKEDESHE